MVVSYGKLQQKRQVSGRVTGRQDCEWDRLGSDEVNRFTAEVFERLYRSGEVRWGMVLWGGLPRGSCYLQGVDGEGAWVCHGTRGSVLQELLRRLLVRLLIGLQHPDLSPPAGKRKV